MVGDQQRGYCIWFLPSQSVSEGQLCSRCDPSTALPPALGTWHARHSRVQRMLHARLPLCSIHWQQLVIISGMCVQSFCLLVHM
ncbi:hypothetical protein IscW_ISCW020879 [Ixodes scapularis]|uniref:Uncharacterized protein n=1 Tax=Ixodes scapularis TaxID=6945 RepID=B7Q1I9_IXOSC|nr:hypothetical protein IscW_ISCW020879 [Ixodes scapularis]|eukprot:XP_002409714.1 hypothetical protein IscW_ISCW020879 [Ixodes scapularis]